MSPEKSAGGEVSASFISQIHLFLGTVSSQVLYHIIGCRSPALYIHDVKSGSRTPSVTVTLSDYKLENLSGRMSGAAGDRASPTERKRRRSGWGAEARGHGSVLGA